MYSIASPPSSRPSRVVTEQVAHQLTAACAALRIFLDRPGKCSAAEALTACAEYSGPLSERFWPDILRLLTGRQKTRLILAALELYIAGEPPINPAP